MLRYKREAVILLNMFLNLMSKHIIKVAAAQIERKQSTLTCESNLTEGPTHTHTHTKKLKKKQKTQMRFFYYKQFEICNKVKILKNFSGH